MVFQLRSKMKRSYLEKELVPRMHRIYNTNNTRGGTFIKLSKFIEKKILRKIRFRAAKKLKNVIRFQSLSFLDPLFVFPAISLFVFSTGDFRFFSRIFPLDSTIFVTAYRNNAYTPKHAIRSDDSFSKCNILVPFFPRYFAIFLPFFSSNVFRLDRGDATIQRQLLQHFEIWYGSKIQLFPSFICFSLLPQRLSSRLDPFVAVHRNEKQTFVQFRNGYLWFWEGRKSSFFAGRRKRRVSSNGAGI